MQFNTANELIWTADGTRLTGYSASGGNYIAAEKLCQCWLEVRFGTRDGERRAYLTADYGHYNPGTLVDLELVGGAIVMKESNVYPPGTYALSGVVTEVTPAGPAPVEGASVSRSYGSGWQNATTDKNGFYQIQGLYDGTDKVSAGKEGYETEESDVTVRGDTRFDIQLGRRWRDRHDGVGRKRASQLEVHRDGHRFDIFRTLQQLHDWRRWRLRWGRHR